MRKPKLELDIESAVSDLSLKMIKEKRITILRYCIEKKGYRNLDVKKLSQDAEDVKGFAIPVLTFRYDGELLFREFPTGKFPSMLNKRYELAV